MSTIRRKWILMGLAGWIAATPLSAQATEDYEERPNFTSRYELNRSGHVTLHLGNRSKKPLRCHGRIVVGFGNLMFGGIFSGLALPWDMGISQAIYPGQQARVDFDVESESVEHMYVNLSYSNIDCEFVPFSETEAQAPTAQTQSGQATPLHQGDAQNSPGVPPSAASDPSSISAQPQGVETDPAPTESSETTGTASPEASPATGDTPTGNP